MNPKPGLVIGCGNPSRGDDGLGLELTQLLERDAASGLVPDNFDTLVDFQLQIEHTTEFAGRELLLFLDAGIETEPPFEHAQITARMDRSYSSHNLSPQALLEVYRKAFASPVPRSISVVIRGYHFDLGCEIDPRCSPHLQQARDFCHLLLGSI